MAEARISRIIQVIPEISAGGAERTTVDIAHALTAAGHGAMVLSQGGRLEPELLHTGAQSVHLPLGSKNLWQIHRNVRAIAAVAREYGADLIHARSRAPAWSAMIAARKLGIPFVTTYHGTYSEGFPGKRQYNAIMAKGDRVIANSQFVADRIQRLHKTSADIIRVIPRGLQPAYFAPSAEIAAAIAPLRANAPFPIHEDAKVILMPGRLTRWKGQALMLAALARIRAVFSKAVLIMPGDAQGRVKYVQELQDQIHELALHDCVWMPGHIADLRPYYAMSDIVVSASIEPEAFGRIAMEAQASERPILAAGHGGAMETVQEYRTGLLFAPGEAEDLANKAVKLLSLAPEERAEMGRMGRENVAQNFSLSAMCSSTLSVYEELLCEG